MDEENQKPSLEELRKEVELLRQQRDRKMYPVATEAPTETEVVEPEVSTDAPENTKGKFDHIEPGDYIPGTGMRKPRPGVQGFAQDLGRDLYEGAAPIVGVSDTIIDAINFASAGDQWDIPKLPTYEDKAAQAVRNLSGLVIPSLGLRSMLTNTAAKIHASGKAGPWLQKLGNRTSFENFSI